MYIERMVEAGQQLLDALSAKEYVAIQEAANLFSKTVDDAWTAYTRGEIDTKVRGQSLPKTMYHFATIELSAMTSDPQQWQNAARQVRLFLNMVRVVVE